MAAQDDASKPIRFFLFRNFRIVASDYSLKGFEAEKPKELLCYLLLHRERPYFRDVLTNLLWEDMDGNHARKNFRQALWQLQAELRSLLGELGDKLVSIDGDWIRINQAKPIWCDVDSFEQVFKQSQGIAGRDLSQPQAQALKGAASLYVGDLLEGLYPDWCLFERERLQNIYLMILDKLMDYCEGNLLFEDGIIHGMQILKIDVAREKTHRCLMKLYYLSGDRTSALRQYERCVGLLQKELQVGPSQQTIDLGEQMRTEGIPRPGKSDSPAPDQKAARAGLLSSLLQMHKSLSDSHRQVSREIETMIENLQTVQYRSQGQDES